MNTQTWTDSVGPAFSRTLQGVAAYLPHVVAALTIALLGWAAALLLARVARFLAARLQGNLDRIAWLRARTQQVRIYRSAPGLAAGIVFWTVLLFCLVAAVEALRLPALSNLMARVAGFFPRAFGALLILTAGILGSDVARHTAGRALARIGVDYADALARLLQGVVLLVTAVMAVEQLGIASPILSLALAILFGTTLGAAGLAFGLGAREVVANMLAVQQVTRTFAVGDTLQVGEVKGRIVEFTQTAVVLDGPSGRILVPGQRLARDISTRVREGS
jgi:small-conductance mechanosensitive channel